ncbi:hypothetical protein As57867_004626, partial [Aphanomyces stellatus]
MAATQRKNGIVLFDVMDRHPAQGGSLVAPRSHHGTVTTTPTPSTTSSGKRAQNTPFENSTVRTNFKAMSDTSTPLSHTPCQDTDSPILEDIYENNLPPAHTQDAFAHAAPKFSSWAVLAGALVGVAVGAGLYYAELNPEWQKVVALPGNLFLRALRCLIVPMVFCVMTVVVAEAVAMGRTSMLRFTMVLPYVLTSVLATVQGIALAILFQASFKPSDDQPLRTKIVSHAFNLTIQCPNGLFLVNLPNGSGVGCAAQTATNASDMFLANQTTATTAVASVGKSLSLMDQVVAITDLIVPVNIFASLANGDLLSIVLFAIPVGIATALSAPRTSDNSVLKLIRQFRTVCIIMLGWLLAFTPVAIVFLMAAAVSTFNSNNISSVMSQVGIFIGAFVAGASIHVLLVLPALLIAFCRVNPF